MTGALVGVQLSPEFVDVKIGPTEAAATSFVPSADEARETQLVLGALVNVQVWAQAGTIEVSRQLHMTNSSNRYFAFTTHSASRLSWRANGRRNWWPWLVKQNPHDLGYS
jgi:hypothetical protein